MNNTLVILYQITALILNLFSIFAVSMLALLIIAALVDILEGPHNDSRGTN